MIVLGQRPWERMLVDLNSHFRFLEQRLSLVHDIDQSILGIGQSGQDDAIRLLEELFLETMQKFSSIHRLESPLLCYVSLGSANEYALLQKQHGRSRSPKRITISTPFEPPLSGQDANSVQAAVLSEDDGDDVFRFFRGMKTMLLFPMFSKLNRLICVFAVADVHPKAHSRLDDSAFASSLLTVVTQLSIAYNQYDRALETVRYDGLWQIFLQSDRLPAKCFADMANRIHEFLPSFGAVKYRGELDVQILMELAKPHELVIRGTTGVEPEGTRIAIDRSITGLLIQDQTLQYLCVDPTAPEYHEYFKNYLGRGKTIRTELAVRFAHGGKTGVLNLESERRLAFNDHHIDAMLRLAKWIAEMLTAIERRLEINSSMQESIATSTAHYLDAIAKVYRHNIQKQLNTLKSNIQSASDTVQTQTAQKNDGALLKRFERLLTSQEHVSKYSSDFLADISGYSKTGPTDLRAVVDAAIKLAEGTLLTQGPEIEIAFDGDAMPPETRVFCSPLLKQHLYSILDNAVREVHARQRTNPGPGKIWITISEDTVPPDQEVELNQSWAVSIRDNGGGVKPAQLERLKGFEPGLRFRGDDGTGSGLAAAHRFLKFIGGRVDLDSRFGKWFEVTLHMNEASPTA